MCVGTVYFVVLTVTMDFRDCVLFYTGSFKKYYQSNALKQFYNIKSYSRELTGPLSKHTYSRPGLASGAPGEFPVGRPSEGPVSLMV